MESQMDAFIDRHLWFLPLPRFGRTSDAPLEFETVCRGALIALSTICDDKLSYVDDRHKQDPFMIIEAMYRIGWPHMVFLRRQGRRLLAAQAYVICLMALDPKTLSMVQQEVIDSIAFTQIAQTVIREEMGSLIFLDGPEEYLKAVSTFIDARDYKRLLRSCPRADSSWLRVDDLTDQNLVNDELRASIDTFVTHWTTRGLKSSDLDIRIKNLLDEMPEIGIFLND